MGNEGVDEILESEEKNSVQLFEEEWRLKTYLSNQLASSMEQKVGGEKEGEGGEGRSPEKNQEAPHDFSKETEMILTEYNSNTQHLVAELKANRRIQKESLAKKLEARRRKKLEDLKEKGVTEEVISKEMEELDGLDLEEEQDRTQCSEDSDKEMKVPGRKDSDFFTDHGFISLSEDDIIMIAI